MINTVLLLLLSHSSSFTYEEWSRCNMATLTVTDDYSFKGRNSGYHTWTIKDANTIRQMLGATNKQQFVSKPFEMMNLKWQLEVYPNGHRKEHKGYVCVYLTPLEMPPDLQSITLSMSIRCNDTIAGHSNKYQYLKTKSESKLHWGFGAKNVPLSFWKRTSKSKESTDASLSITVSINIQSLNRMDSTNFNLIHRQNQAKQLQDHQTANHTKFEWNLKNMEIEWFKRSRNGQQFISPIFANQWQLSCYPNGCNHKYAGKMSLYLLWLNPPHFVESVRCKIAFQCPESGATWNATKVHSFEHGASFGISDFVALSSIIDSESLTISVDIAVVDLTYFSVDTLEDQEIRDPVQIAHILTADIQRDQFQRTYQDLVVLEHDERIKMLSDNVQRISESMKVLTESVQMIHGVINGMHLVNGTKSTKNGFHKTVDLQTLLEVNRVMTRTKGQDSKEAKDEMSSLKERVETLERELATQYKPRIQSLWNGLQRVNVDMKEQDMNESDDLRKRVEKLEENMNRIMNESKVHDSEMNAVRQWMNNVVKLPQYLDLFVQHGFDDLKVIQALTMNDLEEMGIEKRGHRIRIVQAIASLKVVGAQQRQKRSVEDLP